MFKRLFFLISIVLVLGLVGNASADLVARWTFDDETATDSGPTASHHGTLKQGGPFTSVGFVYDAVRDSNVLDCFNPEGHNLCSVVDCGTGGWADITPIITMAAWTKANTIWHETGCYLLSKGSAYQFTAIADVGITRVHSQQYLDSADREFYGTSSLLDEKWHHVVYTHDTNARRMYFDGELEAEEFIENREYDHDDPLIIGGRLNTEYDNRGWDGRIDDLRLYDHAVTYAEVREMAENYKAYLPVPSDGEQDVSLTLASIGWKAGIRADEIEGGHKVYMGTVKADVIAGTGGTDRGLVDSNSYNGLPINPGDLAQGTQYYWLITAVNDAGPDPCFWPGNVWSFTTVSLKASEPRPVDTAKYVGTPRERVYWRAGFGATNHAVYFGTNQQWVIDACEGVYKETYAVTSDPNWEIDTALLADETYYWRVDVNVPVKYPGDIWSFTASTVVGDVNFIAWWKLDETSKDGKHIFDATGREHYGTLTQGAANTSIDIIYDADMDSNVLDVNNPPNHLSGSVVDAGGDPCDIIDPCWADIQTAITVAGWTKLGEMHTTNLLLSKNGSYQLSSVADAEITDVGDGRIRALTDGGVFDPCDTYSFSDVNDFKWHHIAMTYDSGTKQLMLYIDGDTENAKTLKADIDDDDDIFPLLGVSTWTLVIGGRLQPNFTYRSWNGFVKDVRIYDRALSRDEIHVIGVTDVNKAWGPYPRTAADPVSDWPLQLYWIPGDNAAATQGHEVYFGTDKALVEVNDVNVLLGTYDSNTAPAPSLSWTETYYWKVNELNSGMGAEWPGKVWWFRMGAYIPWDDFESYGFGMDNLIGLKWELDSWPGATINLGESIDKEPTHDDSSQSMIYEYDNIYSNWNWYSEAYRDFGDSPQDWSYATRGVKSLQLNFYGETGNDLDDMYVVLEDSNTNDFMKLYDGDSNDLKAGKWKEWDIVLSDFTTVHLGYIKKVYLGFGERGLSGGDPPDQLAGTVYFDDFRVYPPHCVPDRLKPDGDVSEDCIVDNVDANQMAHHWLDNDYTITPSDPNLGPSDSNLIGYWNFDDGTANDSSGNIPPHHGTLIQGHADTSVAIVYDTDRDSNVLEVDNPDNVINSVVDCNGSPGDTSEPNWAYLKEQISIAAWFKVDTFFQEDQYMLTRGASYQVRRYQRTDEMGCHMGELTDTVLRSDTAYSSSDIDDGKWHHVAYTYENDVNERKVYIDGRLAGTDEPNGPLEYHKNGFVIGGRIDPNFNDRGWDGWIDEVRLYDDVLTHEEVVYIMTKSTSPQYFEVWSLSNLTDVDDPCEARYVNFKDYNILADTWLDELLWPSGW